MRKTPQTPDLIQIIEKLQRRTQIDPATLDIQVDKGAYPWKVQVKGVRQVVGDSGSGETFELGFELVRASREEQLEGLLVWAIRAKGDPIETVLAAASGQGGRCHELDSALPLAGDPSPRGCRQRRMVLPRPVSSLRGARCLADRACVVGRGSVSLLLTVLGSAPPEKGPSPSIGRP
jgi:hypothetical protein